LDLFQGVDGVVSPVTHHYHIRFGFFDLDDVGSKVRSSYGGPGFTDFDVRVFGTENLMGTFCRTPAISVVREEEHDMFWFVGLSYIISPHPSDSIDAAEGREVIRSLIFLFTGFLLDP